jgi:hypothetical protein
MAFMYPSKPYLECISFFFSFGEGQAEAVVGLLAFIPIYKKMIENISFYPMFL